VARLRTMSAAAAAGDKRGAPGPEGGGGGGGLVPSKKPRCDSALVASSGASGALSVPAGSVPRTSDLPAPIMKLSGHAGEVLTARFSPCGAFLATAGFDKTVLLWDVFRGCRNYCALKGHHKAVLQLVWAAGSERIYSCSADRTVCVWDAEYGEIARRLVGHGSHVNAVATAREDPTMVVSGGDDSTCRIWDARARFPQRTLSCRAQCTAVEASADGRVVFEGGIDNVVRAHDLRRGDSEGSVLFELEGHLDTVTGVRLSPDGTHLLTNGMDNTVRSWDVRPFVPGDTRAVRVFLGAQHNHEKNLLRCAWGPDGRQATAGSSDWLVHVWDVGTGKIAYKLPGHRGSVNEVDFHPTQPVVASCSSDKSVYLGELEAPGGAGPGPGPVG